MTITLQRWLGIRLDFLGNILILGIALFGVGFRNVSSNFSISSEAKLTLDHVPRLSVRPSSESCSPVRLALLQSAPPTNPALQTRSR